MPPKNKVSLVCPSLVAYPDAIATITVAIFNRRRPHVFRYFQNGDSFSVLVFCPHANGVFRQQKVGFPKRSPEWSYSLKNAGLSLSLSGRTKTDVFEYDDVMIPSSHSFGLFRVDRPKRFEYATCRSRRVFFLKTENKISPLKYPDTCGKGQP